MPKAEVVQRGLTAEEADRDRYPTLNKVVRMVLADAELANDTVERIEITTTASGEATYRVWAPRAEEFTGGYFPATE